MATWNIQLTRAGSYQLTYRNSFTQQVHVCGEVRGDTPMAKLVGWVVQVGEPKPGDLIVFPDRSVLHFSRNASPVHA